MLRERGPNFEEIKRGIEEIKESGKETAKTAMEETAKAEPLNGKENVEGASIPEEISDKISPETKEESVLIENKDENESNPENKEKAESEHQRHEREMDEKTQEAKEEVEARFREALAQLYARICVAEAHNGKPLSKSKIREAIDNTEVLSGMWELPKNSLTSELEGILKDINEKKDNKEIEPEKAREMFVDKAMETNTLGLIMDLAAMKEGGDAWLYEKQAEMLEAQQPIKTASPETPISPEAPAGISRGGKESNPPAATA